jgi:predicted enzyme related to lactoylglutathione lyase
MASKVRLATLVPIQKMDRAVRFYTKTLGGKLKYRGRGEMKDLWASLKLGGNEIWLIVPEKREPRTLAYTTLLVKNIEKAVNGLTKKGVTFRRAEKMSEKTRIRGPIAYEKYGASAFFKDPEGNLLMLWQNTPPM